MSKEYTGELLATKIIGICMNQAYTVEEISRKIYKDGGHSKSIVRVFQCVEILLKHGVLVPKFNNRVLKFQVDKESLL